MFLEFFVRRLRERMTRAKAAWVLASDVRDGVLPMTTPILPDFARGLSGRGGFMRINFVEIF